MAASPYAARTVWVDGVQEQSGFLGQHQEARERRARPARALLAMPLEFRLCFNFKSGFWVQ